MTTETQAEVKAVRSLLHNPLSYLGLLLALSSLIAIASLLIVEFNTGRASPYIGILSYMALPALLLLGLAMVPVGMGLENRRRRSVALLTGSWRRCRFRVSTSMIHATNGSSSCGLSRR